MSGQFQNGLVLVGCGRMGAALLKGCLDRAVIDAARVTVSEPRAAARVTVIEPHDAARAEATKLGVRVAAGAEALGDAPAPDLILIAVKPQVLDAVLPAYEPFAGDSVFLSIAAGRMTHAFTRALGDRAAVIRAMPNTPAQVGRGITALYANANASSAQKELADALMGAVGEVVWLDHEGLMDAVTAVSGSGPAYIFHLIEALAAAARAAGLADPMAARLAHATVTGAAELAYRSDETAEALRRQVTSPGGTTEAALEVLMADDGLTALMTRAVEAAARRSRELAE